MHDGCDVVLLLGKVHEVLVLALQDVTVVDHDDGRAFAHFGAKLCIVLFLDFIGVVSLVTPFSLRISHLGRASYSAVQVEDDASGAS